MILIPLALILISSLVALFILKKHKYSNTLRVPPGPKPWPIIGNLNLMGSLPHQSLHKLSQTYGPIIHLKFGSFPVVVVSSPDIAKQGRKIYLNELFSSKRLASYEYIRVEERRAFTARLFSSRGCQVVLKDHLSRLTLSVISRIVLGRKYFSCDDDGDEFQEMLDELFLLNGVLNIGDWIPWMDLFDLQGYVRRMKGLKVKFDRFHEFVLDEHRIRMGRHVVGKEEDDFEKRDMVDHLLRLANDPNLDVKLNDDSVKGFLQVLVQLYISKWAMSELMKQPKLIEKATKELDEVVGRERWVEERDIPNLPFIDAIMKETMRKHPVAVLLAPHLALEDCTLGGYDVAKDTRVFINTWSMGRDPSVWAHPEEFMPERFLGELNMDVKGQCYELLPFGSGRRMCPGYSLGLKMISSTLANLLHGFDWKLPQGVAPEDLSMDEVYGLATPRKYPLVAIVEPRLPISLYDHHY
ncbi:Trimethyltridecatetraene synthase [Linum perenne]